MAPKQSVIRASSSTSSKILRFDDEASAERERGSRPPDDLDRAGYERQLAPVRLEHQLDDVAVDRLRLVRHSRVLVEEPRPLRRAHSHHRPLDLCVVTATALTHVPLAHRVPDLFRGDEHAVKVEDDGFDHTLWYVLSR